jgi:hypothetical protein
MTKPVEASTRAARPGGRALALVIALLAGVCMWCYADFVLIPHQISDSASKGVPRGNLSDLYPRWLGARELLLHGRDPYSAEITREIQTGYYGRPLDPARPNDPKDQQGFAYPVYIVFFLAPTVRLSFAFVQLAFRWLLIVLTVVSVPLWFRALGLRLSPLVRLIWIVAVLGSFPGLQAIKLQQLSLLVCTLLAAAAAAWASGWLILTGILLAIATIKPQLVCLLGAWLGIWTLGNWRERQRLFWGFTATMALLFAGGEVILQGWVHRFRASAADYWTYTGGGKSVLDVALPTLLGRVTAVLLILLAMGACWRMRREPAGGPGSAWTLALTLAVTLVVIPTYATYNQLLLLPALMLLVHSLPELQPKSIVLRFFLLLSAVVILWPWVTAATLDLALLFLSPSTIRKAAIVPPVWSLAIPLAVLGTTIVAGRPFLLRERATSSVDRG